MALRRPPLQDAVVRALIDRLRGHQAKAPLPSELKLAAELGVSRQTVREALRTLEGAGHIVRLRGIGSFSAQRHNPVEAGLEALETFVSTIARAGSTPKSEIIAMARKDIPPRIASALSLGQGASGFVCDALYFADALPVVVSRVYVPRVHVRSLKKLRERTQWDSMLSFFTQALRVPARYAQITVLAQNAPAEVARLLKVRKGHPLLVLEGVTFGDSQEPLMYGQSYFRSDAYRFRVIRRPPTQYLLG